jgi:hypothetical protein
MRARKAAMWMAAAGLGLAASMAQPCPLAFAQTAATVPQPETAPRAQPRRRVPRITVVPLSHYYRQCDFWLAVEHRPSGDVITPQQHCWWALR